MKYFLPLLGLVIISSCVHDPPTDPAGTVNINMNMLWGNSAFEVGEVYTDVLGHHVRVANFKAYLSEIYLTNSAGRDIPISNVEIIDFASASTISAEVPPGNYTALKFGLGVPESWNKDVDPSTYENDHPLSAVGGGASMFWTWNTGYIFVKFDGHADLTGNDPDNLEAPFAFHCGEDFLYHNHEFDKLIGLEDKGIENLTIDFQVDKFLYNATDTINLEEDFLTHTGGNPELATRFMTLANEAISLQ